MVVGVVAEVMTRHPHRGRDPGAGGGGGGRGRGRRRGRGERGRPQALDPPALLADPHVAAALQEAAQRGGGRNQGRSQRRGRRRAGGGVGAQWVLQEPLWPRAQIRASSHPSPQPARQRAGTAVQFAVAETHVADQADGTRGGQSQAGRVTQDSTPSTAQRPAASRARTLLTGDGISELC